MVRTVEKRDLNINYIVACEDARLHRSLNAFLNCGDILLGNYAAHNRVDKLKAFARVGLNLDLNMAVLT